MVRTQIYLTSDERAALEAISKHVGKKQSELIREAVDDLIGKFSHERREGVLERLSGLWRGRNDLPDFSSLRKEWDRGRSR